MTSGGKGADQMGASLELRAFGEFLGASAVPLWKLVNCQRANGKPSVLWVPCASADIPTL